MRHRQQGLSFTGFLLTAFVLALAVYVGARLLPSYVEYFGMVKALQRAAAGDAQGSTQERLAAARQRLGRHLDSQYVDQDTVQASMLRLQPGPDGSSRLVLAYDKRIHMFFNIDAWLHFEKSVPMHDDGEAQ